VKEKKYLIVYVALVLASHLPLVVFDLRHDFINTKALVSFVTSDEAVEEPTTVRNFSELPLLITNTYSRVLYTPAEDIADELTLCTAYQDTRTTPPIIYSFFAVLILIYAGYLLYREKSPESLLLLVNIGLVSTYFLVSQ